MTATVYAVVTATIQIPVRASSAKETLEELYKVSLREADNVLRRSLGDEFRVVGAPVFSHAIVQDDKKASQ